MVRKNSEGQIWKECCLHWTFPKDELWIFHSDRIAIYCKEHEHKFLCYEDEIDEGYVQ